MFSTIRLFWQKKQQIKKKELVLFVKEFVERNSEFIVWSGELPFIKLCKVLPTPTLFLKSCFRTQLRGFFFIFCKTYYSSCTLLMNIVVHIKKWQQLLQSIFFDIHSLFAQMSNVYSIMDRKTISNVFYGNLQSIRHLSHVIKVINCRYSFEIQHLLWPISHIWSE